MKRFFAVMSGAMVLVVVAVSGCQTANKPPETPSVPSGPTTGRMDAVCDFTSAATDPDDDSVAIRFAWGDGDTSAWSGRRSGGDSITASHAWADSGTYRVKAQARDEDDAASGWSAGREIRISAGGGNELPNTPSTPSGPDTGLTGAEYTFASTAADPDGDSIAIRFAWGDGDTSNWSSYVPSGDTVEEGHSWADSGTYSVKAQAMDEANGVSDWSAAHTVKVSIDTAHTWPKTYGGTGDESGRSVYPTEDGGCIMVGSSNSPGTAGGYDVYVVKTDSNGSSVWQRFLGGQSSDHGWSVQQTTDGGYIVAGATESWQPVGDHKMYLAKLSASGSTEWQQQLGYDDEPDEAYSVQQTRDGGYILSGYTRDGSTDNIFLVKRHADGSGHWAVKKGFGDSYEYGWCVRQTADDGYVVVGQTDQYGDDVDVFLVKVSSSGETDWYTHFDPGSGQGNDYGYSIRQTSDGGYIIAGMTNFPGTAGGYDVYLVKTDGSGNITWQRTFGGQYNDVGYSAIEVPGGGYIVAGYTGSFGHGGNDVYLIRTDASGDTVWTRTFGGIGNDGACSVERQYDKYLVMGSTSSYGAGSDFLLLKVDANGNIVK